MDEINNAEPEPEVTILVCGRTGIGKSCLINEIFGANVCRTGGPGDPTGLDCVTNEVESVYKRIQGVRLTVYDSPGLQDGTENDDKYIEDINNYYNFLDLVLYCVDFNAERWLPQENKAIELLSKTFKNGFWERAIVVFTRANKLQNDLEKNEDNWEPMMQRRFETFVQKTRECLNQCNVSPDVSSTIPFLAAGFKKTRKLVYVSERCGIQKKGSDYLAELWVTCLTRMKSTNAYSAFMQATFSSGRYVLDQDAVMEVEEEERNRSQGSKEEIRKLKTSGITLKVLEKVKECNEKEKMEREKIDRDLEKKRKQDAEREKKRKEQEEDKIKKAEEKQRKNDEDDKAKNIADEENESEIKRRADQERKRIEEEEEIQKKESKRNMKLKKMEDKSEEDARRIRAIGEESEKIEKINKDEEVKKLHEAELKRKEEAKETERIAREKREKGKVHVHKIPDERIKEMDRMIDEAKKKRISKEKEKKGKNKFDDVQVQDNSKIYLDHEQTKQALRKSPWKNVKDFFGGLFK